MHDTHTMALFFQTSFFLPLATMNEEVLSRTKQNHHEGNGHFSSCHDWQQQTQHAFVDNKSNFDA